MSSKDHISPNHSNSSSEESFLKECTACCYDLHHSPPAPYKCVYEDVLHKYQLRLKRAEQELSDKEMMISVLRDQHTKMENCCKNAANEIQTTRSKYASVLYELETVKKNMQGEIDDRPSQIRANDTLTNDKLEQILRTEVNTWSTEHKNIIDKIERMDYDIQRMIQLFSEREDENVLLPQISRIEKLIVDQSTILNSLASKIGENSNAIFNTDGDFEDKMKNLIEKTDRSRADILGEIETLKQETEALRKTTMCRSTDNDPDQSNTGAKCLQSGKIFAPTIALDSMNDTRISIRIEPISKLSETTSKPYRDENGSQNLEPDHNVVKSTISQDTPAIEHIDIFDQTVPQEIMNNIESTSNPIENYNEASQNNQPSLLVKDSSETSSKHSNRKTERVENEELIDIESLDHNIKDRESEMGNNKGIGIFDQTVPQEIMNNIESTSNPIKNYNEASQNNQPTLLVKDSSETSSKHSNRNTERVENEELIDIESLDHNIKDRESEMENNKGNIGNTFHPQNEHSFNHCIKNDDKNNCLDNFWFTLSEQLSEIIKLMKMNQSSQNKNNEISEYILKTMKENPFFDYEENVKNINTSISEMNKRLSGMEESFKEYLVNNSNQEDAFHVHEKDKMKLTNETQKRIEQKLNELSITQNNQTSTLNKILLKLNVPKACHCLQKAIKREEKKCVCKLSNKKIGNLVDNKEINQKHEEKLKIAMALTNCRMPYIVFEKNKLLKEIIQLDTCPTLTKTNICSFESILKLRLFASTENSTLTKRNNKTVINTFDGFSDSESLKKMLLLLFKFRSWCYWNSYLGAICIYLFWNYGDNSVIFILSWKQNVVSFT